MARIWTVSALLLATVSLSMARVSPIPNLTTSSTGKSGKLISLFSIVQFPNDACTAASSSTVKGTCLTSTECTSAGGSADGKCAAGFGICCVISTSTCSSTVNTNTTYIRNADYPGSHTPSASTTCSFTVSKVSPDICQLRLDFTAMSGFITATNPGQCSDKITAVGQSGVNPPEICGTNTGYHMYTEFGMGSTDTIGITITYADTTTAKNFDILLSQIACDASWKAPVDCVQYFTGIEGTIQNYGFAGGALLTGMDYNNCIRTEVGYCGARFTQSPTGVTTSAYDTFDMDGHATNGQAILCDAANEGVVIIPGMSPDGITHLPIATLATDQAFIDTMCGGAFAFEGSTISSAFTTRQQPFMVGLHVGSGISTISSGKRGFSLDYLQVPCL